MRLVRCVTELQKDVSSTFSAYLCGVEPEPAVRQHCADDVHPHVSTQTVQHRVHNPGADTSLTVVSAKSQSHQEPITLSGYKMNARISHSVGVNSNPAMLVVKVNGHHGH